MATLLLLLIAAACFAASAVQKTIPFPKEKCTRANEEFEECKSRCEYTCDTIDDPDFCPPGCAIGCTCKIGFVRDDDFNCVEVEKCPEFATGIEGIYLA